MQEFNNLFQPLQIKSVVLKNRMIMAPMATRFATVGGYVTPRLINYYAARAQGGVGLVTVEAAAVSPEGKGWGSNVGIWEDEFLPGLTQLATAIHNGGAKAAIQIFHTGRRAYKEIIGQQPVAPSPIPAFNGDMPIELSLFEIEHLIENFANAALRAKQAGFDIVNLHVAHGYILHQFLSPLSNKRTDLYGGDLARRARIILKIITRIRELVGPDYPLFCRLTGDEFASLGLDLAECQKIACILEGAGVDLIDVTGGGPDAPHKIVQPMTEPRGCLVHLAAGIKQVVNIPVAVVGRINNPRLAEEILSSNHADLIVMGRPLIADPELPNKAFLGKENEIRPCIACNQGCLDRMSRGVGISCLVNPLVGGEGLTEPQPVAEPKNIVVVGGGVGGMEAAVIAAQRGHKVVLLEKNNTLGGQALLAAKPPHKEEIDNLVRYLVTQLGQQGVSVELSKEVDELELKRLNPDEIIIATGAKPLLPNIPGLNPEQVTFAWDVLSGSATVSDKVLIIGGGQVGCETAELLLHQGKMVTVLEMGRKIARDMEADNRGLIRKRLAHLGADIFTDAKVVRLEQDTVYIDQLGVELVLKGFVSFVIAAGVLSYNPIGSELDSRKLHLVGDCSKPARLFDAIHAGFRTGKSV